MYPEALILLITNLTRDLRKALSSEILRKDFDSILQQTFSLQSPTELMRGITPSQKLCVLRTALQNFEDKHSIHLYNDWVKATFKFAEQLIKASASKECKMVPPVTDGQTVQNGKASTGVLPKANPIGKKPDVSKGEIPKKKTPCKLPNSSKRLAIYAKLETVQRSGVHVFAGQKHITCRNSDCAFCISLFVNIPLTKCKHKACAPGGWYPHVGERLWSSLKRYHETPGTVFVPKKEETRDGQLPSIVQFKLQRESGDKPTSSSTAPRSKSISARSTASVSTVKTSYTPKRPRSSVAWAEEVEQME